ncbi:hypothetical protein HHI36_018341 [Cryptolaemus montrouzieri]|uniref:Integrase zinc-binding domain-containing protein n=1 Tax=Cryptolaemus montrouzieri TaxID=559131 RepID=A0ABD2P043_9CUCU
MPGLINNLRKFSSDEELRTASSGKVPHQGLVRSATELREEQLKDPEIQKILESFSNTNYEEQVPQGTNRGYMMTQGVLYRYDKDDDENAQLVIPTYEREEILKTDHDAPTAGHYGVDKTS